VRYALYVFHLADSTSDVEFSYSTFATPGVERAFRALPTPLTILNDQNAYVLCVAHDVAGPTNQNAGATLWYKLQVSPAPASATFGDVPTNHPFFRFVEALAAAGITAGCGNGNFCPDQAVTRGQMAVFLSVALGMHFPN
jgi:hypothetical protein